MPPASPTPTHTLLLLDLPPSLFCGIDLLAFTTPAKRTFHGLKHIPPGLHFFFISETASVSIRTGFWFQGPDAASSPNPTLTVRRWSNTSAALEAIPISKEDRSSGGGGGDGYRSKVEEVWEHGLSPYRQAATGASTTEATAAAASAEAVDAREGDWEGLIEHVTPEVLTHLLQDSRWEISSSSSMLRDRDHVPGLTPEETGLEERELGGLGIDLKRTWREGALGRERTEGAMDASWALGDVVERLGGGREEGKAGTKDDEGSNRWGDVVLGQMEACFIMVMTVANYSCLEEWKRCVGLVLKCKKAVDERQSFMEAFLVLLKRQIEKGEDVEGGLFDMSDEGGGLLKMWLMDFKRTLVQVFGEGGDSGVLERMEDLEVTLRKMYGWELGDEFARKGMVQLDDGEMIEMEVSDMHGVDEDGEYAPVVVDLENT